MKFMLFCCAILLSGTVFAETNHYVSRNGNHVHHLKITKIGDEINVGMDVEFEPNENEKDAKACSAEIIGKAKSTGDNVITLKKHSEEDSSFCKLDITVSATGAKVEQSKEGCNNFVTGICHFSTEGKEIPVVK